MTSAMESSRARNVLLCGLILMVAFLYLNAMIFVSVHDPPAGDEGFSDRGPYIWRWVAKPFLDVLRCIALPAWLFSGLVYEPFYGAVVYYPLLAGVLWFGYGCLIAWGFQTHRLIKVLIALGVLWSVFFYMYWILHIW
jgi:hypothetical protein